MSNVFCPVMDPSCPYLNGYGHCLGPELGWHPKDECDDYYAYIGDEEKED